MSERVLITGGAGFIGSHLADRLIAGGRRVRVLDSLVEQVHGEGGMWPDYLDPRVERRLGDVRDRASVEAALEDADAVVHLSAAVVVGQSMYEVAHYTAVNNLGTAVLLEALIRRPVRRLVVASSMSIYGEGLYAGPDGQPREVPERRLEQLQRRQWEPVGPEGEPLVPLPTPEDKLAVPSSVYALSKEDQERLCLMLGAAYHIPTVALRFFNVYGPRQSLSNPYTGVLAIFASRLLNGRAPAVYEDGLQRRDFVDVRDVALACELALDREEAVGHALNVGSGRSYSILEVARQVAEALDREDMAPEVLGKYRVGDIRHCFADLTRARSYLGYEPQFELAASLGELAGWLQGQSCDDRADAARGELDRQGLWL